MTFHALTIQIRTRSNRLEVVALRRFLFCGLLKRREELFRCNLCWPLIGNNNFFSKKRPRGHSFFLLNMKCLILCVFCSHFLRHLAWRFGQFLHFCARVNFDLFSYRFYSRLLFKGRDRRMLRSTSPFYYSIAYILSHVILRRIRWSTDWTWFQAGSAERKGGMRAPNFSFSPIRGISPCWLHAASAIAVFSGPSSRQLGRSSRLPQFSPSGIARWLLTVSFWFGSLLWRAIWCGWVCLMPLSSICTVYCWAGRVQGHRGCSAEELTLRFLMPHRWWGSDRCFASLFTFLRIFIWEIWAITAISMSNCQSKMVIYLYFFVWSVGVDYRRLPLFAGLFFWGRYWFPWVRSYRESTRRRLWGLLFSFTGWVSPLFSFWCLPNFSIFGRWHRDRAGSSGAFSREF